MIKVRTSFVPGAIVLLAACANRGSSPADGAVPDQFESGRATVSRLAPGVFAVIRNEPLGLAVNSNSMVVVGERAVLVVDAQFTREATLETLAAIRRITSLPVGWVVNTHWHDDHLAGNQVYRDSFPGVRFVMHEHTVADLATLGAPNRTGTAQGAPPLVERYDRLLAMGLGIDSTAVSPAERASVTSALRIMRRYLEELPAFSAVGVTDTVLGSWLLRDGITPVEVSWLGCGNTRGDLIVRLPQHDIVAAGDLVVWPVPFGFNSYPATWPGALDSLIARRPRVMVPGHGPVQRDTRYAESVRDMLLKLRAAAEQAAGRGDSLPALLRSGPINAERAALTGGEKWMTYMFDRFFAGPVAQRAWADTRTARRPADEPGCN